MDARAAEATVEGVPPSARSSAVIVSGLGLVQILAWGSSYYLLAVLGAPISAEMGWSLALVVGGFSLAMAVSGVIAPRIGRIIAERGGRPVLIFGCLMIAAGQCILGLASSLTTFFAAWLVIGLGMAASLYDAAFSTLGRLYGADGRRHITALTLFGGFASTLCWPLSAYFAEAFGWRGACFAYAAIQIGISLPIIWLCIPREAIRELGQAKPSAASGSLRLENRSERLAFGLLTVMLMAGGIIASLLSVHLLALLQDKGLSLAAAVSLGALVGPSQVGSRVVEIAFGRHYHPLWTLAMATALMAAGVLLLFFDMPVLFVAILLYGAGNGIWSIARGTVPLAVFGSSRYAVIMGKLAMPSLIAQAAAPFIGAVVLERGGSEWAIGLLAGLALINVVLIGVLARTRISARS